jgi:hypothetical protein
MPFSASQLPWFVGGATVVFLLAWFFGFSPFPRPSAETFLNVSFSAITAAATAILAKFTITIAKVGNRQVADTRILQRAYIAVEPEGIEPLFDRTRVLGHVGIKNAGNLPARHLTWFISLKMSNDYDERDFPIQKPQGNIVLPPGAISLRGSQSNVSIDNLNRGVDAAPADRAKEKPFYLYVWGAVRYHDGFTPNRETKFCHRYNWQIRSGFEIPARYGRYHEHGNDAT